jgi:hypothetical protein
VQQEKARVLKCSDSFLQEPQVLKQTSVVKDFTTGKTLPHSVTTIFVQANEGCLCVPFNDAVSVKGFMQDRTRIWFT